MSVATAVESGFSKVTTFLLKVFTKTSEVDATFAKLAPTTKAAVLATFYDTVKTVQAGAGAVAAAESGDVAAVITLSANTETLVKTVIADAKTDTSVFAADLKALGI